MSFSFKHVKAIFKKEIKDFGKNLNVLSMCFLPILFSFIYSNLFGDSMPPTWLISICLGMSLTLVSSYIIAMMIAEEKEKYTLRTLMLSSVSPMEFLAGKALFTLLISIVLNTLIFIILGLEPLYIPQYLLLSTLVCISMLEIGAVIGLLADNQMATGIIGLPIILALFMIPLLSDLKPGLKKIAYLFPNYNLNILFAKIYDGQKVDSGDLYHFLNIIIWIVLGAAAFIYVYHKKGLDK